MSDGLTVVARGRVMGLVVQKQGRLRFRYDSDWSGSDAFPLSLSMPISGQLFDDDIVAPFLANLLPDNENTIAAWSKEFQTSTNPFALLRYKGRDCPGAIQFVPEESVEAVLSGEEDALVPLSEEDISLRLQEVVRAATSGARTSTSGQFSLAGAQPKLSLAQRDGAWVEPFGRHPTTHILKPAAHADGLEVNEHFCLALARKLGLTVPATRIMTFGDIVTIVVERYDRDTSCWPMARIHQEDMCQALGVHPRAKYQNEGGPSAQQVIGVIRDASSRPAEDAERFVDAFLFNFVVAGTDAHAKNYSFLLSDATTVRLAPFYDMASALPHLDLASRRVKLAMKIGDHYSLRDITTHDLQKEARSLGVAPVRLMERLSGMLRSIPDRMEEVLSKCEKEGLEHPILPRLNQLILQRVEQVGRNLGL